MLRTGTWKLGILKCSVWGGPCEETPNRTVFSGVFFFLLCPPSFFFFCLSAKPASKICPVVPLGCTITVLFPSAASKWVCVCEGERYTHITDSHYCDFFVHGLFRTQPSAANFNPTFTKAPWVNTGIPPSEIFGSQCWTGACCYHSFLDSFSFVF